MKKNILLLITILTVNVVTANTIEKLKDVNKTIDTTLNIVDTSSVTKQIYNDIKSGIIGLSESLKISADHVYKILVKQQLVYAILYLTLLIISIILIINWIKKYNSSEIWKKEFELNGLGIIRTIQIVISLILLFIVLININDILTGLINPEYGAIKEIMSFIK